MAKPVIAVLEGDGVGPELTGQALATLQQLAQAHGLDYETAKFPCGGEYYQQCGQEWPEEAKKFCVERADAIFLGSVGVPGVSTAAGDLAGVAMLFFLRQQLDLYANVRPARLDTPLPGSPYRPEQVDLLLVREATEGLYTRIGGTMTRAQQPELALDVRTITEKGCERVIRFAFEQAAKLARAGDTRGVTSIDKSNVLQGCRVWRGVAQRVAAEYPGLKLKFAYVDNFALEVLRRPEDYGVCVTSNAFGDILADIMAYHEGSVGMGATANYGATQAMFEGLAGAQYALRGKGVANPVAIHRCLVMMLDWLGQRQGGANFTAAARQLEAALVRLMTEGKVRTPDIGGKSTTGEVCDALRGALG